MDKREKPTTEQLILEAAEEEFLLKGFDGARTTAIAERAGVTHAMLHYYFRTKEQLFERIVAKITALVAHTVLAAMGSRSAGSRSLRRGQRTSDQADRGDDNQIKKTAFHL